MYYSTREAINRAFGKRFQQFYWRVMTGATVTVTWPKLLQTQTPAGPFIITGDPNDAYRPWLEEHVGKQGRDWQWHVQFGFPVGRPTDNVTIHLRRGKTKFAPMIGLMWQ